MDRNDAFRVRVQQVEELAKLLESLVDRLKVLEPELVPLARLLARLLAAKLNQEIQEILHDGA